MKNKKILVIAAHPDDEILGCGGTIAKLTRDNEIYCLILGEGITSRSLDDIGAKLDLLKKNAIQAQKILGIKEIFFERFSDNQFDGTPLLDIVKKVEEYVYKIRPDIIFTHHHSDLNIDHRLTFQAVLTCCRPQPGFKHPDIYCFEIPSSTDWQILAGEKTFKPNVFIDISDTLEIKLKALKSYKSEMRDYPHSRSLKGVKIMSQDWGRKMGKTNIEAFCLIRSIRDYSRYIKSDQTIKIDFDLIEVKPAESESEAHKRGIWIVFNENIDYNLKTSAPVPYEDHCIWWEKIFDKEYVYIVHYKSEVCGYIRLTKKRTESKEINEISIAILKKYHNTGLGTISYRIFEEKIKKRGVNLIIALTDKNNKLGREFFEKSKYEKAHIRYVKNL